MRKKGVRLLLATVGSVFLVCCGCLVFATVYGSTPEAKARATERAIVIQTNAAATQAIIAVAESTQNAERATSEIFAQLTLRAESIEATQEIDTSSDNTPTPTSTPELITSPTAPPLPTDTLEPTLTSLPTNTPVPTSTPVPTNTPLPTNTPVPTNTPDPLIALLEELEDELGPSNREDVERVTVIFEEDTFYIKFAIQDNFTAEWIRQGMANDTLTILAIIDNNSIPYEWVVVEGTFPLVDAFGNVREATVLVATYSRATIGQINFGGTVQVFAITDEPVFIHQAMLED